MMKRICMKRIRWTKWIKISISIRIQWRNRRKRRM